MTTIRRMDASEIERIGEIDRSEYIGQQYRSNAGVLELVDVDIDAPRWGEPGAWSVQHYVDEWGLIVERGGVLLGAFDDDTLAGFAIYEGSLPDRTDIANFAVLHVSRPYRRSGVACALAAEVFRLAREDGHTRIYVSATPTRGTVDFYMSVGFVPLVEADPVMFEREPEDIHLERVF
jgi:GNAT superfamily N-acetyltransferase